MARASLSRLAGDDVDAALLRSVRMGHAKVRGEVIRALVERRATQAVDKLFRATGDGDETVRRRMQSRCSCGY